MALLDALNGSNVKRPGAKQLSPLEQRQIGTMRMAGLATGMLCCFPCMTRWVIVMELAAAMCTLALAAYGLWYQHATGTHCKGTQTWS